MPNAEPPSVGADTSEPRDQDDRARRSPTEAQDCHGLPPDPEANDRDTVAPPADDRAVAVADTAGALTGVYEPAELDRLREEWPA